MGEDGLATANFARWKPSSRCFRWAVAVATASGCRPAKIPTDPDRRGAAQGQGNAAHRSRLLRAAWHHLDPQYGWQPPICWSSGKIETEGGLDCRVTVPFHFKNFHDLDKLETAVAMHRRYRGEKLKSGFVKMFYDGVIEGYTAIMIEPYADRPDERPEPLFTPERFKRLRPPSTGSACRSRCIRSAMARCARCSMARAAQKANGRRDSRHRIEHIESSTGMISRVLRSLA